MEYNKSISDLANGDRIEGFYVLKSASLKTTVSGKPFFSGIISDRSGYIDVKIWDYNGPIGSDSSDSGKVVKIRGEVSEFKGCLQLTLSNIRFANEQDQYDLSDLVPVAPVDKEHELTFVRDMVSSLEDVEYRRVCEEMLHRHLNSFRQIPAAKSVHHSFISGLLMHTCNMLRLADFLAKQYQNVIDRSLLLTGTLLHDFAKEQEFAFSELGIVTDYSTKGQLLGHLVMGAQEVAEVCAFLGIPEGKSILLQHMILSHHGEPDYGAAVRPLCAEAELLSYIDMIDSRMEIYEETLPSVPVGGFSGRIFALEKRIYHHE